MKKLLLLPLTAALAVVVAGSGGASTQSPAAAASALIKCGKTQTIGIASPLTGDAASLGLQQLRWAKRLFLRTARNDAQQRARVGGWISGKLKSKRVYIIDDEEAYSQGLADQVQKVLSGKPGFKVSRDHVSQSVSDFSSVITRIPSN